MQSVRVQAGVYKIYHNGHEADIVKQGSNWLVELSGLYGVTVKHDTLKEAKGWAERRLIDNAKP